MPIYDTSENLKNQFPSMEGNVVASLTASLLPCQKHIMPVKTERHFPKSVAQRPTLFMIYLSQRQAITI